MFPYLFQGEVFGHAIRISTYGVLLAIAFSQSYFFTSYLGVRGGLDRKHIDNVFLLVIGGAIVGGRLFHVLFENFAFFRENPAKIFAIWEKGAGFTFYGSFLTAVAVVFVYTRRTDLDFRDFGDCTGPPLALGLAIGRFACFSAGCCWGKETSGFLSVVFTHPDSFAGTKHVPVHPVQLYGATASLVCFGYFLWRFRHREYRGQLLAHGLGLYAISRFIFENFRGDTYRGHLFGGLMSYSQAISLAILPASILLGRKFRQRDRDVTPVV